MWEALGTMGKDDGVFVSTVENMVAFLEAMGLERTHTYPFGLAHDCTSSVGC